MNEQELALLLDAMKNCGWDKPYVDPRYALFHRFKQLQKGSHVKKRIKGPTPPDLRHLSRRGSGVRIPPTAFQTKTHTSESGNRSQKKTGELTSTGRRVQTPPPAPKFFTLKSL